MSIVGGPASLGESDTGLVANDMMDLGEEDDDVGGLWLWHEFQVSYIPKDKAFC